MVDQADIKQFYDSFSRVLLRDFSYLNLRQDAVRDLCRRYVPRGARVLEIGCGVGIITKFLQKTAARVVSVDISAENIAIAREFASAPNTTFLELDILDKPHLLDGFGGFDAVVLADVVEHIPRYRHDALFTGIQQRLNDPGIVVLTYPTPEHQEYLKASEPQNLQVVDERVEFDRLLGATDLLPVLFQYKNVWRENDYAHVVLTTSRRYAPAPLSRTFGEWLAHRLRKYRWRLANIAFLRRLRRRLAEPHTASPPGQPVPAAAEGQPAGPVRDRESTT